MLDPGGESDEDADYSKMDMVRVDFWCFKGLFCLILSIYLIFNPKIDVCFNFEFNYLIFRAIEKAL